MGLLSYSGSTPVFLEIFLYIRIGIEIKENFLQRFVMSTELIIKINDSKNFEFEIIIFKT